MKLNHNSPIFLLALLLLAGGSLIYVMSSTLPTNKANDGAYLALVSGSSSSPSPSASPTPTINSLTPTPTPMPTAVIPPSVAIIYPADGQTFRVGATIGIAVDVGNQTSGATINKVEIYESPVIKSRPGAPVMLTADTSSPFIYYWSNIPAGTYSLTAKAYSSSGSFVTSQPISISDLGRSPKPPKPTGLTASAGSVILNWNISDYPYFTYTAIYRDTTGYPTSDPAKFIASTTADTYHDTNVSPSTTYYYSLFTVDDVGNYSDPTQVTFTTPPSDTISGLGGNNTGGGNLGGGTSLISYSSSGSLSGSHTAMGTTTATSTCITASSTVPASALTLKPGVRGQPVVDLQTFLVIKGYLNNQYVTGYYGSLTKAALTAYLKEYEQKCVAMNTNNQKSITPPSPSYGGQSNSQKPATSTYVPSAFRFTRALRLGSTGTDVKYLQVFLNENGFPVSSKGTGSLGNESTYFGPATMKALIKFQEANATAILKPFKLTKGTGYFGTATMKVVNGMLYSQ